MAFMGRRWTGEAEREDKIWYPDGPAAARKGRTRVERIDSFMMATIDKL